MSESDQESTCNTDDLISGIHRLDDISPLQSPREDLLDSLENTPTIQSTKGDKQAISGTKEQHIMSEDMDSGKGSSTMLTPQGTCFDLSNSNTALKRPVSPRSRSLSPQNRIRVHYTDSAREALDLANKSYEKLVEESDQRHHLSILINQRDAERAELIRKEQERVELERETRERRDEGDQIIQLISPTPSSTRHGEPVGIIQEHLRFAESILASPNSSSSSDKRSRSLSPMQPRTASPAYRYVTENGRSRSSSPLTRSPHSHAAPAASSRKKLEYDRDERSTSPLLSRSGREKTVRQIRTKATNDFIDATSHGLHSPRTSHRVTADRMAAVSSRQQTSLSPERPHTKMSPSSQRRPPTQYSGEQSRQTVSRAGPPLSSTPHKKRDGGREISPSRLYSTQQQQQQQQQAPSRTTPSTPSSYIRGLESVRVGLRKLMTEETDPSGASNSASDASNRAENVSMRIESTINAENQLLRDQLSRERNLRKQIEGDKHELQSQLLESKDRLHHLNSSLKQKDGMMKKLDQNLEDVVKGWQKHEQENKMANDSLSHTVRKLERELEEQRLHIAGLETDLSNAVDDLKRERDTSREFAREVSDQEAHYKEGLTELRNTVEREQEKVLRLDSERTQAMEGRLHVEKQLDNIQETLEQERENFKEREDELLDKINEITSVQIAVLEKEAARTKEQAERIEKLDAKAKKFEQELESQRHLVSSRNKELERLQSLLELTEAKQQNSLRQLESKLRIELELRVSQAKDEGLKRMADNEIALQQAHQRQLAEVVSEHNRQLGMMRERSNNEINRIKNQTKDQLKSLESAVEDKKQELDSVLGEKENVEAQRDDLNNRLQAVLTLLGAAANGSQASFAASDFSYNPPRVPAHPKSFSSSSDRHRPSHSSTQDQSYTQDYYEAPTQQHNSTPLKKQVPHNQLLMVSTTDTSVDSSNTSQPNYQQQYEEHRQQYRTSDPSQDESTQTSDHKPADSAHHTTSDLSADPTAASNDQDDDDAKSTVSTETYDLNENDSMYRHKRQAELQDYIKKLLNRSVGDPLIETRIDLDESHISVISGLHDHSVILHDPENHDSPKKAFRKEIVTSAPVTGHTPPVKGSSKKVNPREIATLITKYGAPGSEGTTPSTAEYIQYLKSVAVNNHTGFIKEFGSKDRTSKKDLTESFNRSSSTSRSSTRKRSTSFSRVKPSSPDKTTVSKQAKEIDRSRVKRHSASSKSQAIWK